MGNRRLTLAVPPFALSSGELNQGHGVGMAGMASHANNQSSDIELLEMDLEDWMNTEHFPAERYTSRNPTVALGLPKHSQKPDCVRGERIQHLKVSPIAAVDAISIAVGNIPIRFCWANRNGALEDPHKSIDEMKLWMLIRGTNLGGRESSDANKDIGKLLEKPGADAMGAGGMETTRQSSRIQNREMHLQTKAMLTKAAHKGAMWSIWKSRNDAVFNKKVMASPVVLIHKTMSLLKNWSPLLKPKMKPVADEMLHLLSTNPAM